MNKDFGRRPPWLCRVLAFGVLIAGYLNAATVYVWQQSPSPTAPFTNWATAAHNIQDAVDASVGGDLVLVTNGIYRAGGAAVSGALKNRIAITKPVEVRSVNGPSVTSVDGAGLETGDRIIRCAFVGDGAVLSGFYLYYGTTMSDGDLLSEQSGGGVWCADSGIVTNCWIVYCSANEQGGGAYGGILRNCIFSENTARNGGGVAHSKVLDCKLGQNSANLEGGGGYESSFAQCTLGGSSDSDFLGPNSAYYGGGCAHSTLTNCIVFGNSVGFGSGGGSSDSTLFNCTVASNTAAYGTAGGVSDCILYNCIVYYNSANGDPNHRGSTFFHCCTAPLPTAGIGNITDEPGFVNFPAGDLHIRHGSPCVDTGFDVGAGVTVDFDGKTRPLDGDGDGVAAFDIGAYEYVFKATRILYVWPESPAASHPYTNWFTAAHIIQDAVNSAQVGDTIMVTNGIYSTGYGTIGTPILGFFTNRVLINKAVTVKSVNGPAVTILQGAGPNGSAAVRCAYVGYGSVLSGFTLTNGHTSLFNGDLTRMGGGGAFCETMGVVTNCILTNNSGYWGGGAVGGLFFNCTIAGSQADRGGGCYGGSFYNCRILGNSAPWGGAGGLMGSYYNCVIAGNIGDGIAGASIYNCTVVSNSGSGICSATAYNSIIYGNAHDTCGPASLSTNFWCITSEPTAGVGNLTNAPDFVNAALGDFRLRYGSAGIDAGTNLSGLLTNDLDGKVRPLDGDSNGTAAFDIGAFEYDPRTADSNGDGIPDWWTLAYGLDPNDPEVSTGDPDNDGVSTFGEWIADTNPTNASSYFLISKVANAPPVKVGFQSSASRHYTLYYSTNLGMGNLGSHSWVPVADQTDVLGNGSYQFLTDTNAAGLRFYRIGVRP